MPRYALKIEYNGTGFAGWQIQDNVPSVQGAIEAALAKASEPDCQVYGAGRTDTGVHALAQVAHVDLVKDWDPFRLSEALNYHLKESGVAILDAAAVPEDFHARFGAKHRRYMFRLLHRRAPIPLDPDRFWRIKHPLDTAAMQEGAAFLIGKHDFTTFRSTMCQAPSPLRTLDRLTISEHPYPGGTEYRFDIRALSFLHNQVRSFVGTLERVGAGSWAPEDVRHALEAKDRAACGTVAPPQGLYLAEITYDPDPFS